MNAPHARLFGGALAAAGLQAGAQEFVLLTASPFGPYASIAIADAASTQGDAYTVDDSIPLDVSETETSNRFGTATMSASTNQSEFRTDARWHGGGTSGFGFGGTRVRQFFEVTQQAEVVLQWDGRGTDGYLFAEVLVDETLESLNLVSPVDGDFELSGTVRIPVDPAVTYVADFGFVDPISGFAPFIFDQTSKSIRFTLQPPRPATLIDLVKQFGVLNADDVAAALHLVASGEGGGDFNQDGSVDFFDVLEIGFIFDAADTGGTR